MPSTFVQGFIFLAADREKTIGREREEEEEETKYKTHTNVFLVCC